MRTNLQVPVDKTLRDASAKVAKDYGFTSLQDAVRMFLTQLANRKITVSIVSQAPDETLTIKQEAHLTKKYKDAMKEIKAGKGYLAQSAHDLAQKLNSA